MTHNTGTWLIAIGGFIVFTGLCMLPAAFGPNAAKDILGVALMTISTGMMLVSGGFYIKALKRRAADRAEAAGAKRGRKVICDQCRKFEPIIQCRVHEQHLCANCLREHYDFRSCAYVPSPRRGAAKPLARSQASSA